MENSFLKFYKTLNEAIVTENPTVTKLPYSGFVQQKTNETFCQITNSDFDIVFVGGYTAELVNGCGDVIRDITDYFYFDSFTDNNGIKQIAFEVGMLNTNYYSQILYIKLTDLVNSNIWYSAPITITNKENSIRIDYWSTKAINGTAYDIAPFKQSIRLSDCYKTDVSDEVSAKQYTVTSGNIVAYRRTTTLFDDYVFESCNEFTYRRLNAIFNNDYTYIDGKRVVLKEIKKEAREGDSNKFKVTLTVNPYEEVFNWSFQIFEGVSLTQLVPSNNSFYTLADFITEMGNTSGQFIAIYDKLLTELSDFYVRAGVFKIYKDDVLWKTINEITFFEYQLQFAIPNIFTDAENGVYTCTLEPIDNFSGAENYSGIVYGQWVFTIADGEFDSADFSNEFLIN